MTVFSDLEITLLEKLPYKGDDNQLTKTIRLNGSGYESDAKQCQMRRGNAWRRPVKDLPDLAEMFQKFGKQHAIALGRLRDDLTQDSFIITTKKERRPDAAARVITRTKDYLGYAPGRQALALIDTDYKGIPTTVRERIDQAGGLQAALTVAIPELSDAYRLVRPSTSSGLFNQNTGEQLPGSQNAHTYIAITDGADAERFLRTLFKRCWLADFGWHMIDSAGRVHERSLVDQSVFSPERLVFEGPPVVLPPLKQNQEARRPTVLGSIILDSKVACPDLTKEEQTALDLLIAKDRERIAPEVAVVRDRYVVRETAKLVKERSSANPLRAPWWSDATSACWWRAIRCRGMTRSLRASRSATSCATRRSMKARR
jgi:hypothetical protein